MPSEVCLLPAPPSLSMAACHAVSLSRGAASLHLAVALQLIGPGWGLLHWAVDFPPLPAPALTKAIGPLERLPLHAAVSTRSLGRRVHSCSQRHKPCAQEQGEALLPP